MPFMRRCAVMLLSIGLLATGCATAWRDAGGYYRGVQTRLSVQSTPPGARVFLNDRYLGNTPVITSLECEQQVKKKMREVSYWISQPGWSLLLSIASLGLYVPFSLIPVDTESAQEPTDVFKDNEFSVRLEADGYKAWSTKIACGTQLPVAAEGILEKI